MADISQITLPSGTTYNIKDATARELIGDLSSYTKFLGVTTTALTDGATTNPITIDNKSVTAASGNIVTYGSAEFIFNGTSWQSFGDLSGLGSLAYKNSASGSYTPAGTVSQPTFTGTSKYLSGKIAGGTQLGTVSITPAGTVSQPTFTGTQGNVSVSGTIANSVSLSAGTSSGTGKADVTPAGTVSQPTFTGTEGNVSVSGTIANSVTLSAGTTSGTGKADVTPAGTVSQPTFTGEEMTSTGSATFPSVTTDIWVNEETSQYYPGNYTPKGTVSKPNVTVTPSTTTVNSITAVGTLPSCTLPSLTCSVANENLTLGWSAGSFSAGTLPTKGSNTTVMTGASAALAADPVFTGAEVLITGATRAATADVTVTGTPEGTVSKPTFTGTAKYVTATVGTASKTMTGKFTPAGTVSQPTFTGTAKYVTATVGTASKTMTGTFTPAGTVSQPTFTGTAGSANVVADGNATTSDNQDITVTMATSNSTSTGAVDIKPAGTVSKPTFTGTAKTVTVS